MSSEVWSEEWDRSMARPSWFIRVDGAVPEGGEAAVGRLVQPAAEGVGIGVGDPDLPDPQAVQHVQAVELVLDRGRGLEPEDQPDRARGADRVDVGQPSDQREPGAWARSASRMPRSVMMSFQRQGAFPVTQAVPSIRLSNMMSTRRRASRVGGVLPPGPVVARASRPCRPGSAPGGHAG